MSAGVQAHELLTALRLSVSAAAAGESGDRIVPVAAGKARFRFSHMVPSVGPRPMTHPCISYRLSAPDLTFAEEDLLGRILGDDSIEARGETGIDLRWQLGPAFQTAAEIAAAYSPEWFTPVRPADLDGRDRASVMRWTANRLGPDRVGEAVVLDGTLLLVVLVPDEATSSTALPSVEGTIGRGIYALPAGAVRRLLTEEAHLLENQPITALAVRPRGQATRWRDRHGRLLYRIPLDSSGLAVVEQGRIDRQRQEPSSRSDEAARPH